MNPDARQTLIAHFGHNMVKIDDQGEVTLHIWDGGTVPTVHISPSGQVIELTFKGDSKSPTLKIDAPYKVKWWIEFAAAITAAASDLIDEEDERRTRVEKEATQ